MDSKILFFSSATCGPCRLAKKQLTEEIRQELNIVVLTDEDWTDFANHKITSVPTFIKVVDGKEVSRKVGFKNIEELRSL
jgi:hypothetical protein